MSKVLVDLLGVDSRLFQQWIDRLERACLQPSIDIRLSTQIQQQLSQKIQQLGLDHTDSTPHELYYALRHRLQADESRLRDTLGLTDSISEQAADNIATLVTSHTQSNVAIGLTPAGVRRLLLAYPPKKTMRHLKLRSIESVVKRTDPRLLYCLAKQLEDDSWQSQVQARMKRMNSKDIDWQSVEVLVLPISWYEKIAPLMRKQGLWLESPETATICLLPQLPLQQTGSVVLLLGRLLQVAEHFSVLAHSHADRVYQIGQSEVLVAVAKRQLRELQKIHGMQPSWHVAYTLTKQGILPAVTVDGLAAGDDIEWLSVQQKLLQILEDTSFWSGSEIVGLKTEDGVVSFHILDVALDALTTRDYAAKTWKHLQDMLMHELQKRYMTQDIMKQALIAQVTGSDDKMDMLL